jgi:hypothetical protein
MLDSLELGLNVKNTGAINTTCFRIRIWDLRNAKVPGRRQIAFAILRPQIMAASLPPSSAGTPDT